MKSCEKVVRKLWKSCEKVVRKLWESCKKDVRKLWKSYENVVKKLWERCEKVIRKLWESCEKVVRKLWESCEKIVKKLWKRCEKVVRKLWESCEKVVRKLWESLLLYFSCTLLSRHVCSCLFSPNLSEFRCPWRQSGGSMTMALPFRQKAMVKSVKTNPQIKCIQIPKYICPRIIRRWNNLKIICLWPPQLLYHKKNVYFWVHILKATFKTVLRMWH